MLALGWPASRRKRVACGVRRAACGVRRAASPAAIGAPRPRAVSAPFPHAPGPFPYASAHDPSAGALLGRAPRRQVALAGGAAK